MNRRQSREPWTGPDGLIPMAAMGALLTVAGVIVMAPDLFREFVLGVVLWF